MRTEEFTAVFIFVVFWSVVASLEIGYLFSFIRKKVFLVSGKSLIIHVLAVSGILCFLYGYFVEPYWIDVRHVEIVTDKLKKSELTVIQISDLHCDEKIRNEQKLPSIVNKYNPDIVIFTGDTLNTPKALPIFKKTLSDMRANIGKYAVRGNFDVWYWKSLDLFGGTGFHELDGRTAFLSKNGEKFAVSGISADDNFIDPSFPGKIPGDSFNILLFHYPGIHEELLAKGVDLFLSGHTHGGQIALPFYGALVTLSKYGKKYEFGRYNFKEKIVYVNRGIGMEGGPAPRVRFFARPEVTVFHIRARLP